MGFHPVVKCVESDGFTSANKNVSPELLRRMKVAYRLAAEASHGTADSMWTNISINHKANKYRVLDLRSLYSMHVTRLPCWMRYGYVEEIYVDTLPSDRAYQESTKGKLWKQ